MADEKPKSVLEQAIDTFEAEVADCRAIRKDMIAQLHADCKKMRVSEYDKAMMVSAKMSMITTLNGMLKDVEDAAMKRVKFRMTQQEQEQNGSYAQACIALLKLVRADGKDTEASNQPKQSEADIQDALTKRGDELGIKITKGEIEECVGLPGGEGYKNDTPDVAKQTKEEK